MQALSWPFILLYCLFSIFVFYQQLHMKKFHGSSQVFAMALNISGVLGMLTGLAYLATTVGMLSGGHPLSSSALAS
jgi:hypothetical protein